MESLTPVSILPPEECKLTLSITDSHHRVHELEVIMLDGHSAKIHVFGDNIKLGNRLRAALDAVQRNSNLLF